MRARGFEGMTCSVASVMGALGDRWGALIMRDLFVGLTRFDDLQHSTGATTAMLSDRLKLLVQNGLVERRQYANRPDRYEYVATPRGRDIGLVLLAMLQIGDKWNLAKLEGPPLRVVDRRSGRQVKMALVDAQTGKPVAPEHLSIEMGPGADEITKWRFERRDELQVRPKNRV